MELSIPEIAQGIIRLHAALRRSLDTIISTSAKPIAQADRAGFADFCGRFIRLLTVHHDGEEEIIFPKIVEGAKRASQAGYVTEVGQWRGEHEKLLVHLEELETARVQFAGDGKQEKLHEAAKNLRDLMLPHLDGEEATLNGDTLARLLRPDEALEMITAAGEHGQRTGGPGVLMLVIHSLTNEEQKAHFADMPWFVRKLLVKWIWASGFQGCLKYAHNASIAL